MARSQTTRMIPIDNAAPHACASLSMLNQKTRCKAQKAQKPSRHTTRFDRDAARVLVPRLVCGQRAEPFARPTARLFRGVGQGIRPAYRRGRGDFRSHITESGCLCRIFAHHSALARCRAFPVVQYSHGDGRETTDAGRRLNWVDALILPGAGPCPKPCRRSSGPCEPRAAGRSFSRS
ncbi:hypothetical protein FRUB_00574 [Fimbriiglobus ruber]|uniref:Uncharacterized protein n=1 Tax=Fimbriiglobus ruber TaxID=1908690 RepID=A0A225EEU4_9BACT|nr:hypothetical protein FRUB_00574 [Fimbriiglobus ruber]